MMAWNDFFSIDKNMLLNFGLVGRGNRTYFNSKGQFIFNGIPLDFQIESETNIYTLTNMNENYTNIIQYKNAYAVISMSESGSCKSTISQYNFGYEIPLVLSDKNINFKVVCAVPYDKPIHFKITLTSDKILEGNLVAIMGNRRILEKNVLLQKDTPNELVCRW
jgi:hypothetical protein